VNATSRTIEGEIPLKLADKKCSDGGSAAVEGSPREGVVEGTRPRLETNGRRHLERRYTFKDFAKALALANKVGAVAEAEGHHPDRYLAWGKCKIEIWSHLVWLG
jgi:4a-hydroxytetrahydrobiopterin dehydratase